MKPKYDHPALHSEAQMTMLLAYAAMAMGRKSLKCRGVLDQLWAMVAGLG